MSPMGFSDLGLRTALQEAVHSLGYKELTPVQAAACPPLLAGKDVLVQAETGSGKTVAFGLGILEALDSSRPGLGALVLCPTRELAEQVAAELRKLARNMPSTKILTLCGGSPMAPQIASLTHGASCVVGTPGRVGDHLQRGTLRLGRLKTLVLDEADRMLDMGFADAIDAIIRRTPHQRQTLLFSATYPDNIGQLSAAYQRQPHHIKLGSSQPRREICQEFLSVDDKQRLSVAGKILAGLQAESALVFCNTKQRCAELASFLREQGISVLALHGDLEQRDRDQVLALFAARCVSVLVATDVAARGLDIAELPLVLNLELAKSMDTHVHRVGRTGRAGHRGRAVTLMCLRERHRWQNWDLSSHDESRLQDLGMAGRKSGTWQAPMVPLRLAAGRKNKLRPTDVLGALTAPGALQAEDIGKIKIFPFHTLVAIRRPQYRQALQILQKGKVKGRSLKACEQSL